MLPNETQVVVSLYGAKFLILNKCEYIYVCEYITLSLATTCIYTEKREKDNECMQSREQKICLR